jgi:3-dehydroquinate dehydratase-2
MPSILVINGPNLNLLGTREPAVYGSQTLEDIEASLRACDFIGTHGLGFVQSNAEHVLIESVHEAYADDVRFIVINPGAFTHTSIALRDAFLGTKIPFIEVHISNVFARESFRHHSFLSDIAKGVISGLGVFGYEVALRVAVKHIEESGI